MKTFYQAGNRIPYTNTSTAISAGDVVVLISGSTGFIGIAVTDIAATTGTGELCIGGWPEGVHTLKKKTGDSFAVGTLVYWDSNNSRLTTTSSGNTRVGRCTATAASAATTANVKINQP